MNRVNRQKELDRILASLPEGGEAPTAVSARVLRAVLELCAGIPFAILCHHAVLL